MTMQTEIAVVERRPMRSIGRLPTIESVDMYREVVGAAIVRRVHREIGLSQARRILRDARNQDVSGIKHLTGNFFQSIVHQHDFALAGDRRIRLLAEALGLDPNLEIAKAYADPESYYVTCKRHGIGVSDFVRRRLDGCGSLTGRAA